jgi:anthranilate 1,2-dioxygenase small subunit
VVDANLTALVDELQQQYVLALDDRDMRAWADCFAADLSSYVCTTRENEEQELGVALMLDDTRDRIEDRINHITKIWAGTFEDYTTRHVVQRLQCNADDGGVVRVRSNFMVTYTTMRGRCEVLGAGTYLDEIVLEPAGARFRSKRAVLDNAVTARYLVYPI